MTSSKKWSFACFEEERGMRGKPHMNENLIIHGRKKRTFKLFLFAFREGKVEETGRERILSRLQAQHRAKCMA